MPPSETAQSGGFVFQSDKTPLTCLWDMSELPLSVILILEAFKITIATKTIIKDISKIVFFAILITLRIS